MHASTQRLLRIMAAVLVVLGALTIVGGLGMAADADSVRVDPPPCEESEPAPDPGPLGSLPPPVGQGSSPPPPDTCEINRNAAASAEPGVRAAVRRMGIQIALVGALVAAAGGATLAFARRESA